MPVEGTVTIENARIIFRNFKGAEGQYNREGDRNFSVILEDKVAGEMAKDGWNVKYLKPRPADPGEDEHADAVISVSVKFKGRPPRIVIITSRGRTTIGEEDVEMLDYADIRQIDMILNPYNYSVNGSTGVKAYLKSMYVTLNEDELDLKYADVPDAHDNRNPVE